jgi:hypothetical protein
MFELRCPRERMLQQIGVTEDLPVIDGADPLTAPAFLTAAAAHVIVTSKHRYDIVERLNAALTARFGDVAPQMLQRDLLAPLKKAIGNAFKHGNRLDPDKTVTIELYVTRRGAFIEVSDQGAGFDVEGTIARLGKGGKYWENAGSGFRRFAKTDSVISFDNGGRTFRACFRTLAD